MPDLLIATKNAHKTMEIQDMLGPGWKVTDLNAHPDVISPEETGATFRENAEIKAITASRTFPGLVLSDDSGLEVDALAGAPGVRSARYSGEDATDASNRVRLLAELEKTGARGKERSARFHCAMVLAEHGQVVASFDGVVEGVIINQEKGEGGFGYDSLFVPEGHCETFAQLPASVKNVLSHRARALIRARQFLESRSLE